MFSAQQQTTFEILEKTAASMGLRVFLVGGAVRDIFIGQAPADSDLDFAVEGNAIDFAEQLSRHVGGQLKKFPDFFTAKISLAPDFKGLKEIDLASARTETYAHPGKLPQVRLASIEDDLKRRDFSINAMALPLRLVLEASNKAALDLSAIAAGVLDYFNGLQDLKARRLKILHDLSFIDDPTRMFRAVRYAVRLDGNFEIRTEKLMREALAAQALNTISEQRKINELKKVLAEQKFLMILRKLLDLGFLTQIGFLSTIDCELLLRQFEAGLKQSKLQSLERFDLMAALALRLHARPANQVLSSVNLSKRKLNELDQLAASLENLKS